MKLLLKLVWPFVLFAVVSNGRLASLGTGKYAPFAPMIGKVSKHKPIWPHDPPDDDGHVHDCGYDGTYYPQEGEVIDRINDIRASRGLSELKSTWFGHLDDFAQSYSSIMCREGEGRMSHDLACLTQWDDSNGCQRDSYTAKGCSAWRTNSRLQDTALNSVHPRMSAWAEIIHHGPTSAEIVVNGIHTHTLDVVGWMESPGHKRQIFRADFTHIGAGYSRCGGTPYWTVIFMREA